MESSGPSYTWSELITLSTKYRDLTAHSQLALTVCQIFYDIFVFVAFPLYLDYWTPIFIVITNEHCEYSTFCSSFLSFSYIFRSGMCHVGKKRNWLGEPQSFCLIGRNNWKQESRSFDFGWEEKQMDHSQQQLLERFETVTYREKKTFKCSSGSWIDHFIQPKLCVYRSLDLSGVSWNV